MASSLASLLESVHGQLQSFAAGDRFWELLRSAFGSNYKTEAAIELKQQWLKREFSQLPVIRVLAAEALAGANAIYSSRTNVISLSRSFLQTSAAAVVNRVVLEEIGHFLDARLMAKDTPGDEGENFANALLGIALSPAEQHRVAIENDQAFLALDGGVELVEKAEPILLTVTTLADENDGSDTIGLGLSLRDAILFANDNPAMDVEIRLAGGQTYPLRASGFHDDQARKGDLDIKARTGSLKVVATGEEKAIINAANLSIGDRIFDVLENANLSLSDLVLSGGNCAGNGGAIHIDKGGLLTIANSEIKTNSTVSDGGAIYNLGTARLEGVSIQANKAAGFSSDGGGIHNSGDLLLVNSSVANNIGEGIYNFQTIILIGSIISGNSQQGIYLNGASAGLVNTTISGNQKTGIDSFNSSVSLTNCTLTENASDFDDEAGGIHNRASAIFLRNSIIAGNINSDNGPLDLSGEFNGDANNLIGSLAGASGTVGTGSDIVTPDPGLAWLANNGGATLTHALRAGSPAINAGDNTLVALDDEDTDNDGDLTETIPFDTRGPGHERIRLGVVDIGAFESPIQPNGLPRISMRLSPESLAEDGTGSFLYTFTRTGSTAAALTLKYTVSGSATAGADYGQLAPAGAANKTITMAAGTNTATVLIKPIADTNTEADETVSLQLAASNTYRIGTPAAVTGTIINDDFLGTAAADRLTGSIYSDTFNGLAGADVLTGREGADRFCFGPSQSTLTAPDRITDFLINTDKISLLGVAGNKRPIPISASRAQDNATATTLRDLSLSVFADANGALNGKQPLAANQAALVVATHPAIAGTYLLSNDATAALSLANDTMITITGHIGVLPSVGAFVPSTFFE